MSGPGENRWRRPGQANNRSNHNSGTNTPTKENVSGRQQAMPAPPGNAWGAKLAKATGPAPAVPAPAQPEHHVPVKDFNADEVKDFLKKKYLESTANLPSVHHKVSGDSVSNRGSGAWGKGGNMPHLMTTGQDFFTQLKKQLANIDQTKPAQ